MPIPLVLASQGLDLKWGYKPHFSLLEAALWSEIITRLYIYPIDLGGHLSIVIRLNTNIKFKSSFGFTWHFPVLCFKLLRFQENIYYLPLNLDRMFANSLFILFISASLLLPGEKEQRHRLSQALQGASHKSLVWWAIVTCAGSDLFGPAQYPTQVGTMLDSPWGKGTQIQVPQGAWIGTT